MSPPIDQTNQAPQLTLADTILRFKSDAELAHEFVKGDANVLVVGSAGSYPSLAKIALDTKNLLNHMSSVVVKKYLFSESMQWAVTHNLNTVDFTVAIINLAGEKVYTDSRSVNENKLIIDFTSPEAGTVVVTYYIGL